jgi:hypothetical protein
MGGEEVQLHSFLTSAQNGVKGQISVSINGWFGNLLNNI